MIYLLPFVLEIVLLFFLSKSVSKSLSRYLSTGLLSVLFLPGVIVHELSHLFIALMLLVRTGDMEFVPKVIGGKLKLGSVGIEKTDPIRRAIIGFAPVFAGLILILMIIYFFEKNLSMLMGLEPYVLVGVIIGIIYSLFVISNTMFSSTKDMEGTLELVVAIAIILIALYFVGFRVPMTFTESILSEKVIAVVKQACIFLLAPILIDIAILVVIRLINNRR